jgi:tetratricopeptide (TPR) repeat protein
MRERSRCNRVIWAMACTGLGVALAAMPFVCPADQGMGVVSFANSGAPVAQKDFLTGLALLHNFQYPQAAAAFRSAQAVDRDFAMAYWGEAMAYNHPVWAQQDLEGARAVLARLGPTPEARAVKAATPREKSYLHSIEVLYGEGTKFDRDKRYALALEKLHAEYPEDVDATCFYALALLGTSHAGRDVPTYMRAAALMEEAFERHPQHPGAAHYLIHSVDDSVHAPLGLRAAYAYSRIAPDSPHAMHMTSHIFLALGMWRETAQANEAAIRLIKQTTVAKDRNARLPACGHTYIWLNYAYLQQARLADARHMVEECGEEARAGTKAATGADALDADQTSVGSFSAMRTRYLVDSDDWAGSVAGLKVDVSGVIVAELSRDFAEAFGALRHGPLDTAAEALNRAKRSGERFVAAAVAAGIPAEHPTRRIAAIEEDQMGGLLLLRQGDVEGAIVRLSRAAAAESAIPMEFGPPTLDKPANELLGDVLMDLGRAQQARTAYESAQVLAPGRRQSLQGLARCAQALRDQELADSVEARLAKAGPGAAPDARESPSERGHR